MRAKAGSKLVRLNEQIKRAKALARGSEGLVSELYLIHAELCAQTRDVIKRKPRRRASDPNMNSIRP
jgi:hypothetical protein